MRKSRAAYMRDYRKSVKEGLPPPGEQKWAEMEHLRREKEKLEAELARLRAEPGLFDEKGSEP